MAASARVFQNGWVDVDATGLDFSKPSRLSGLQDLTLSSELGNPELTDKIQKVLVNMQKNKETKENMHIELDAYWVAVFLHVTRSPLLQKFSWRFFLVPPGHIFDIKHVIDIGPYVRKLSVSRAISSDVMCRIIQYSLPYVKHNRLNFPRYKDMPMQMQVVKRVNMPNSLMSGRSSLLTPSAPRRTKDFVAALVGVLPPPSIVRAMSSRSVRFWTSIFWITFFIKVEHP